MNVVLLGHSFIRRARQHLLPYAFDIDIVAPHLASELAVKLRLERHFPKIFTQCQHLNFIRQLPQTISFIRTITPSVVVLDIGSNDLSQLTCVDPSQCLQLASNLIDFADLIIRTINCIVIIHSVLPRSHRLQSSPQIFAANCDTFNKCLKNFAAAHEKICFNKLRGFFGEFNSTAQSFTIDINSWSDDGIHCNRNFMPIYLSRLRHGLLFNKHLISA